MALSSGFNVAEALDLVTLSAIVEGAVRRLLSPLGGI